MSKNLTKADVFDVASDLIEQNGSTTTLDIKNELRNRGFFAKQADVSELMIEVCSEENYSFSYNGVHRVYSDGKTNTAVTTQTPASNASALQNAANGNQIIPASAATGKSHTTRFGKVIVAFPSHAAANSGDWAVTSTVSQTVYYFPSTYSRDDVRCAYRAFTRIHMSLTRASRL